MPSVKRLSLKLDYDDLNRVILAYFAYIDTLRIVTDRAVCYRTDKLIRCLTELQHWLLLSYWQKKNNLLNQDTAHE